MAKRVKSKFQLAVEATPEVAACYKNGLQALKNADSAKIVLANTNHCDGSLAIDDCTTTLYPNDHRWDYCFSYAGSVYFVEVHSANTSEVDRVLRKLQWLKDWLSNNAPAINLLRVKDNPYYWIQSNGFNILKNSAQFRRIVQAGIKPIAQLKLPKKTGHNKTT